MFTFVGVSSQQSYRIFCLATPMSPHIVPWICLLIALLWTWFNPACIIGVLCGYFVHMITPRCAAKLGDKLLLGPCQLRPNTGYIRLPIFGLNPDYMAAEAMLVNKGIKVAPW